MNEVTSRALMMSGVIAGKLAGPRRPSVAVRGRPSFGSLALSAVAVGTKAISAGGTLRRASSVNATPNPSVKGTSCGKPQDAPYVER